MNGPFKKMMFDFGFNKKVTKDPFDGIKTKWITDDIYNNVPVYTLKVPMKYHVRILSFATDASEVYTLCMQLSCQYKGTLRECLEYYDKHYNKEEHVINKIKKETSKIVWERLNGDLYIFDDGKYRYNLLNLDNKAWRLSKRTLAFCDQILFIGTFSCCLDWFNNNYKKEEKMEEHKCSKDDDCCKEEKEVKPGIRWEFKRKGKHELSTYFEYVGHKNYLVLEHRGYIVYYSCRSNIFKFLDTNIVANPYRIIYEHVKAYKVFKFAEDYIAKKETPKNSSFFILPGRNNHMSHMQAVDVLF